MKQLQRKEAGKEESSHPATLNSAEPRGNSLAQIRLLAVNLLNQRQCQLFAQ